MDLDLGITKKRGCLTGFWLEQPGAIDDGFIYCKERLEGRTGSRF